MRRSFAGLLLLAALSAPGTARAQSMDPRLAVLRPDPGRIGPDVPSRERAAAAIRVHAETRGAAVEWLAVGGLVGGGLGLVGGLVIGALVDGLPEEDCIVYCVSPGMAVGMLAGEALGIAAGVHLANGRHGSLLLGTAASTGILALGLIGGLESPGVVLLIPIGQMVGAVAVERSTEH